MRGVVRCVDGVGSFSEDRPLGWDPVAEGNRAGDGMARTVSEEKATDSCIAVVEQYIHPQFPLQAPTKRAAAPCYRHCGFLQL